MPRLFDESGLERMTNISLYDGDVTLSFDPEAHVYIAKTNDMEGYLPAPGVTTVCGMKNKAFMGPWVEKEAREGTFKRWKEIRACAGPDEDEMAMAIIKEACASWKQKRDTAAESGTIAHEWIERFIKGADEPHPEDEGAKKAIGAFLSWWEAHHIKVLASEVIVFSRKRWYAGTMDLLAEVNGVLTLADFKTSSGIYDFAAQLGAYRYAWMEMGHPAPQEKMIINIQKNGNLQTAKFNDHHADEAEFLALLEVYRISRDRARPKIERL